MIRFTVDVNSRKKDRETCALRSMFSATRDMDVEGEGTPRDA